MSDTKMHIHGGINKDISLDFSININPLGMPEGCIEAIEDSLPLLTGYPRGYHDELIRQLSAMCGDKHVITGNGSCELIYAICHYTGHLYPGYKALTIAPTFTEYGYAVEASGGENIVFKTDPIRDHMLNAKIDLLMEKINTCKKDLKLVFICNPNNPTGELLERGTIEKIADRLDDKGALLVVDECFLRFCGRYEERTMTGLLGTHRNVIVLDAFTKFYAMPGLRLGYAVSADMELIFGIRECIQPWNVCEPAYAAAVCALKDVEYGKRTVDLIEYNRHFLLDGLKKLSLRVIGNPAADFIMFEGQKGLALALKKEGIEIRDCSDMMECYHSDRYFYRIAVRSERDNKKLISALETVCGHYV